MRHLTYLPFLCLTIVLFACNKSKQQSTKEGITTLNPDYPEERWGYHAFRKIDGMQKEAYRKYTEEFGFTDLFNTITKADKVIGYNWNGNNGNSQTCAQYITTDNQLDETAEPGIIMNKKQIDQIEILLTDSTNYVLQHNSYDPRFGPDCFVPHLSFVYYDKNDKVIGESNICFVCTAVLNVPATAGKMLSEKGVKKLEEFCREAGFRIVDEKTKLSY